MKNKYFVCFRHSNHELASISGPFSLNIAKSHAKRCFEAWIQALERNGDECEVTHEDHTNGFYQLMCGDEFQIDFDVIPNVDIKGFLP